MFDSQYKFYGIHAKRVGLLTGIFDNTGKAKLFSRNLDVYINAPIVGFLYGRTAEDDHTKNPETGKIYEQNIMGEQVIHAKGDLLLNFQLIMLVDKDYEPEFEKRIDKAFRDAEKNEKDEEHFQGYVRGGGDVLYEKLIGDAKGANGYINNLYDFIDDFYDRFNASFTNTDILDLCK